MAYLSFLFLVIALILAILAAINVRVGSLNTTAAALAFYFGSLLVAHI